jgi:tRNA dimethylallyltransferase
LLDPIFVVGPTGVGKSEAALLLAEQIGGELISVDSMQVYRGLDIGTAKPTAEERARVPHHLIDMAEITERFNAAQFVEHAQTAARGIQERKQVPIFCGGTGLYFKAYLEGLGAGPGSDPEVRAALERTPLADLLHELAGRDPVTFRTIDRQNPRRVIRALEVIRLTGKPFSLQRAPWDKSPQPSASGPPKCFGLARAPDDLRRRIDARVDAMFARGLVTETERLLERGLANNRTAMQALGYRQVAAHLRGEYTLEQTIALVKTRTRQFAKRQMTWFRRQFSVGWLAVQEDEPNEHIVRRILEQIEAVEASKR